MKFNINANRVFGIRDIKLYGHFIEHFHRQIYGGVSARTAMLLRETKMTTTVSTLWRTLCLRLVS